MIISKIKYKKGYYKDLRFKNNPLWIFYGFSLFVLDIRKRYCKNLNDIAINEKLEKINQHNSKSECQLYIVKKLSLAICVFFLIVFIGYIQCIQAKFNHKRQITEIERLDFGEGEKKYNLEVNGDKNTNNHNISIYVNEKAFSKEEAEDILEKDKLLLQKYILGKNESLEHITSNLNLISEIGEFVQVEWDIAAIEYIDYSGSINWDKITGDFETTLTPKLIMGQYEKEFTIPIKIIGQPQKITLDHIVENIVNGNNQYSSKVLLPKEINGKKVSFYEKTVKGSYSYILIALLCAVLIYFIKDRDLNQKIKKRNIQMELDYAGIVNKITLLQSSGMTILNAWDRIIEDYELQKNEIGMHYAYEEMKLARQKLNAGYSQNSMFSEFGRKCGIQSYTKFGSLLEQNLKKGSKGLKDVLKLEVLEAFEERKSIAKKQGEEVGTKLLFPMCMMLLISLVIIMVPAFLSIGI